jgi:hypothetical protein
VIPRSLLANSSRLAADTFSRITTFPVFIANTGAAATLKQIAIQQRDIVFEEKEFLQVLGCNFQSSQS